MKFTNTKNYSKAGTSPSNPLHPKSIKTFFKDDNTLWGIDKNGEFPIGGGGSIGRIDYGTLTLTNIYTPTSQNRFLAINKAQHLFGGQAQYNIYNSEYHKSFVDIYVYDNSYNLINTFTKLQFTAPEEFYSYLMSKGVPTNGNNYDCYCLAVVYDVIKDDIPYINKLRGVNSIYGAFKGQNGYNKTFSSLLNANHKIEPQLIEDLINACTQTTGYTYNASDKPEGVIWLPSNIKKAYGLPHSTATMNSGETSTRYGIKGTNIGVVGNKIDFEIDHDKTYYIVGDTNNPVGTGAYSLIQKNTGFKYMIRDIAPSPDKVIAIAYGLKWDSGNMQSVYIKPVGIDTLYLDFFDYNIYDLYALYKARNEYPYIKKVNFSNYDVTSNVVRINKDQWWQARPESYVSKNSNLEFPETSFFLRNKKTGEIGKISNAKIRIGASFASRTDGSFKAEVVQN